MLGRVLNGVSCEVKEKAYGTMVEKEGQDDEEEGNYRPSVMMKEMGWSSLKDRRNVERLVQQVKLALEETRGEVLLLLERRQQLQSTKRSLQSLATVQSLLRKLVELLKPCDDKEFPSLVERAALQFNELQFHMSRCQSYLSTDDVQQAELISSRLLSNLNAMFLDGVRQHDAGSISQCLRIYLALGQAKAAEELFRREVVSPAMQDVISEISLQSDPNGLRGLYTHVLAFIDTNMKELLDLTTQSDR
ncbi:hypothetical protein PR048_033216 [Dryococelus australis]|uniref:Uncharacterized protein n=1 Tax=Dryococelus australis TaxID=614101 RepID=A0ABQ9G3X1_9NEOP|nr:hypothetical protein PR048_033216 [Dryococelus australis]